MALVVRDVLRPDGDVVRTTWPGVDDPAGGVLDNARDRLTLRGRAGASGGAQPRAPRRSSISPAWAAASPGVSRTIGQSAARATSRSSSVGISPLGERCVPVAAGAVRVAAVVQVDEVDPAGDRADVVDRGAEVPAGGPRVAGVEHEAGAELADRVPQPGDRLELAGHRVAAAGGVLDEQRQREAAVLRLVGEGLAPVVDADAPGRRWPARARRGRPCPTAPTAAAACACSASSFRPGMRIRLLVDATLSMYGAWTTTMTSLCSSASPSGRGFGAL